jgi:hypothetical protein
VISDYSFDVAGRQITNWSDHVVFSCISVLPLSGFLFCACTACLQLQRGAAMNPLIQEMKTRARLLLKL